MDEMELRIDSGGIALAGHLATPPGASPDAPAPGLVVCHGFPMGKQKAEASGQTYAQLADELAADVGFVTLTFNFRGTGASGGDFGVGGWMHDLRAAVDVLDRRDDVDGVWIVGASTGGSIAICEAADDGRVRGVCTLASRADFDDWADHPHRFLDHARSVGVIRDDAFPADFDAWARELRDVRPLELVSKLPPRPLLLVHGADDEVVPTGDARALAEAYGEGVELRIVTGAGHRLRHDPRGVAVLKGWLERQAAAAS